LGDVRFMHLLKFGSAGKRATNSARHSLWVSQVLLSFPKPGKVGGRAINEWKIAIQALSEGVSLGTLQ
jgi:hypothetical protein